MFSPLTGRTVLVTGGTKGIGKVIAGVFALAGAYFAVCGRDREMGEAAAIGQTKTRSTLAQFADQARV